MTVRPRIVAVIAEPVPLADWLQPLAQQADVQVGTSAAELEPTLARADALFVWGHPHEPFGRYLDRAPGVRWVHSTSAGIETLLVPELIERRITLTNSRGLYTTAVAEFAVALMLASAKRLHELFRAQAQHAWRQVPTRGLRDATLVIVGLGSIGTAVARAARGLEMHVIGVRRTPRRSRYAHEVVGMADLTRVLPKADYVLLCCPDTPETRGLIGRHELSLLPRGACLINVSRGSVVDEVAMIDALRSGQLGSAGLDVFEQEPLPSDSAFWTLDNVIVSPHFPNIEGFEQDSLRLFFDNVERFINGRRLLNVVDPRRGY